MQFPNVASILLGNDRAISVRFIALAVCLSALSFGAAEILGPNSSAFLWITAGYNALFLAAVLVCLAELCGYHRSGILIACLLTFTPLFALFVSGIGIGFTTGPITPLRLVITATEGALLYGIPLGVLGFFLGTVVRRVVRPNPY